MRSTGFLRSAHRSDAPTGEGTRQRACGRSRVRSSRLRVG